MLKPVHIQVVTKMSEGGASFGSRSRRLNAPSQEAKWHRCGAPVVVVDPDQTDPDDDVGLWLAA